MRRFCLLLRRRAARFPTVAVAVSVLAAVPAALATLPGKDGRIAYMVKDRHGHWQVWVADADLSGRRS